jgi:hypothetical protein
MVHFDRTLRVYAKNGMRSSMEWESLGREVMSGTTPRTEALSEGKNVALFTRDQTQPLVRPSREGTAGSKTKEKTTAV